MSKKILSPLRRDGYKAGMIMMLIALSTMMLTTACSSEDDLVNNTANTENTINKGYALPVTVNVTRQGDATTRATYNESTRKLEFSGGDKLFVYGEYDGSSKKFAGTLDYVPATGKFSGTIYTESPYEDTADALFTAANEVTATLLPNGYDANGSNSFLSIDNKNTTEAYDDRLSVDFSDAFVASETAKATGVEQLSWEQASTYSSGFALSPGNAILNFTISGLAAGAQDVTLWIHYGLDYTVTGSVTPNASGVATFAIGVPVGANIKEGSNNLTVGSSNFTLPSTTTFAVGKIYNIARAAAAPSYTMAAAATAEDIGKVVCAAGHLHPAKTAVPSGCTAVGILGKVTTTGHGLILALKNAATKQKLRTINDWTSVDTYAGTTLKQLPNNTARSPLTSYTTLGSTTVSNWCVAQKSDYEAIFKNLGSINLGEGDYYSNGYTYDDNVNAYITTGVGGTAISDACWSATESVAGSKGWIFGSLGWNPNSAIGTERFLRPVLGF